ncbi:hypothetical protein [Lentzea sp.]|uniref:hypothetical protein n=1 Tax=Lentzea sp. TaxID=56099 RepID=UPI002C9C73E7|nr:hypothetical protein [Lentzea sp.]HUQ54652.1 hypothetical protein [Lentzea sp.]
MLSMQADADLPGVGAMIDELVSAVTAGLGLTPVFVLRKSVPWLHKMTWPGTGEPGDVLTRRYKIKAAYLRRSFDANQLGAIWRNLSDPAGAAGRWHGVGRVWRAGQRRGAARDGDRAARRGDEGGLPGGVERGTG